MVKRYEITGHDWYPSEEATGPYVIHADYRALEERYEALKVTEREGYAEYHRTRVELASIKARVVELVAADHEYDICSIEFRDAYNEGCEETEDLADDVSGASERRRLALEAFK